MLLDSNIIIIASKLSDPRLFNRLREKETALRVSVLTKIEVLGYHQLKAVEQTFLEKFFHVIPILPLDENVVEQSIKIRQRRPVSLADSIIAATAIVNNLQLLTENTKDYARIGALRLISLDQFMEKG